MERMEQRTAGGRGGKPQTIFIKMAMLCSRTCAQVKLEASLVHVHRPGEGCWRRTPGNACLAPKQEALAHIPRQGLNVEPTGLLL